MNQIKPLLSIRFMIFNNEDYINEAIEGILIQKTDFPIEVVVGDDFSTDRTLEIVKSYSNTQNITFKILDRKPYDSYWKVRKKKGRIYNFIDILNNCEGKYIALLDGDDYWTDPLKLQKQVDFLEVNKECVICFHRANLLRENNSLSLHPIPEISDFFEFKYSDLLRYHNFITTSSVVFRKPIKFSIPIWFTKIPFGDLGLYKILTLNGGSIKCLNEVMSVYRIHEKGIYSKFNKKEKDKNYLTFYSIIYPILSKEEKQIVVKKQEYKIENLSKLKYPKFEWKQYLYKLYLSFRYPLKS
ncbi:glycosyltransferase [Planktosalinus lacus]|uniref:Glycosyltransferase 2-like domain-containing protein n=1 Tax=Planktosalinus lacus TaxID=1526573 RepID=A0A8J2V8P9_9FLAO|nr:glycosyltransferase [Planktosalinus lacus]GGD84936.1 hypothetical protein GCM10011312_06230 [Planktosalinus lacus]